MGSDDIREQPPFSCPSLQVYIVLKQKDLVLSLSVCVCTCVHMSSEVGRLQLFSFLELELNTSVRHLK